MQKNSRNSLLTLTITGLVISAIFLAFAIYFKNAKHTVVSDQDIEKYGRIVGHKTLSQYGLQAWIVEKNGNRVVLYAFDGSNTIFTGIVWDARTGVNVSDQFVPLVQQAEMTEPVQGNGMPMISSPNRVGALESVYEGDIPESMNMLEALAGYKEGVGGIADTVYIIIDPRCNYCAQAYRNTRKYIARGYTIKWIPTVALGQPETGIPLAATILQEQDPNIIAKVLDEHANITTEPTEETLGKLADNLDFLIAVFKQNGNKPAGVPAAFFIDHRSGEPRMLLGVSEDVVLQEIFGK